MKKALPAVGVVVLSIVLGFVMWWIFREGPTEDPPANTDQAEDAPVFDPAEFIATFDRDGDGIVTPTEFEHLYGHEPYIFHARDGAPAMKVQEAFAAWDKDKNGVIDGADVKRITDKAWEKFFTNTMKAGLNPKDHNGEFLALSKVQFKLYAQEEAAAIAGELPFASEYFDAKYLGTWAELTEGTMRYQGYVTEHAGKYWLLTADRKLTVFDKHDATVNWLPEAPPTLYAAEVSKIAWDDVQANLELARKTDEWQMPQEKRMLYGRVLIFDGDNPEALEALGYEYRDGRHIEKGE